MNATTLGLLTGLILGLAGVIGGFSGFLLTLVLGAIGLLVGRVLDGELDLSEVFNAKGRDR
ncbi:MAG TPA: hypothetical protein VF734_00515 [Pseudonocardiaceae bacterium]|jgi:nitrate/nitrite transporter NarK